MFDKPIRYETPKEPDTPKQVTLGGFLMTVYAFIGIAVGATWPVWLAIVVTL